MEIEGVGGQADELEQGPGGHGGDCADAHGERADVEDAGVYGIVRERVFGTRESHLAAPHDDALERLDEGGAVLAQVGKVLCDEAGEQGAAARSKQDECAPVIVLVGRAEDEARALGAVNELDGGVVAQEHALGDFCDGDAAGIVQREDLQKLVVLGGNAGGVGGLLAEGKEGAEAEAEVGEVVDLLEGDGWIELRGRHKSIVS